MHPVLFHVGSIEIGTYALFALFGLIAGCAMFSWLAKRDGHDRVAFIELGLWAFVIALGTSKIFGAIVDYEPADPWGSLRRVLRYGGHYYIGVIAGVAFLVIAFRRMKLPMGTGVDYLAPALALAHGIGRIGCLFAGCCYGATCSAPWAITFTHPTQTGTPLNVPLHPTQLYEFGAEMLITALLLYKHVRHRGRPGTTFLWYVVLYGIVRFLVEFVRADARGTFLGMPTSQPIAAISATIAAMLLIAMAGRSRDEARAGA